MSKADQHNVTLTGPGLSFKRPVSADIANRIINLVMTGGATPGEPAPGPGRTIIGRATTPPGELTPKQFIGQKRPSNDYERVACLAYYLTHDRQTPRFKTPDIVKIGRDAAVDFSNPTRAVMHATAAYRYLVKAGGGTKQITTLGEEVVEALPDRVKVKGALAAHKPNRRKRGRSKRK